MGCSASARESHVGSVIRSQVEQASDVAGLRPFPASTLGDRFKVRIADDGTVIGPWRR